MTDSDDGEDFFDDYGVGSKSEATAHDLEQEQERWREDAKIQQQEDRIVCRVLAKILLHGLYEDLFREGPQKEGEGQSRSVILKKALLGQYNMKVLHNAANFQIVRIYTPNVNVNDNKWWWLWVGPPISPRSAITTANGTGRMVCQPVHP